ncbi:hypothetical protein LVD17_27985 [Fulvivirga ulvae]|uniref:hypothetical protein n=1 Tax=Fulvivirga ulvae TaxID=2904245 RepID=UPI001F3C7603|nr:hypothetical protein [Fulvivirga ulvae]UII32129.1 hypothetical protein LVD17_27985 [Fulvivirga ulvae]
MEKEFAGGVLFDKRKTPFEEEGLYGIPGTKNPNDILSFLDQNPFLQGHPYFEELLEKERLFKGFPRDPEPETEAEKEEANKTTAPLQPENNQPENNQEEQDRGNDPEQLLENKPQAKEIEVAKEDKVEKEVDATQTKEEVEEEAAPEKVEQLQAKDKEADQPESPGNKDKTNQPKVDAPGNEQPANIENNEAVAGGEKAAEKKTFKAETTDEFMSELASSSPSDFIQGVQQAPQLVPGIEGKEKETLKESLPEIDKPTGLPAKNEAGKKKEKEKADGKEGKKPELKTKGEAKSVDVNTQHEVPKNAVISEAKKANLKGKEGKADPEEAKAEIRKLPGNDKGVNTNPGKAPKVKLTEEANPVQNTENKDKADESVNTELVANQKQTQNDFGEHDIFPEIAPEKLSPNVGLQEVPALENQGLEAVPEIDAETLAAFNAQAKQQMDEKLGAEKQKQEEAYKKMEVDSDKARKDNEKRIEEETASVKARQEGEQQKAQAEVGKQRTAWQAENEKITADYTKDAAAEKASVEEKIDSEVSSTNEKVEQEFKTAQAKADAKQAEAERDAQNEKDAAEKKDKSFWDRAVDAVSSFIDKVKNAINKIFDALRAFVKQVVEAAKKLAKSIIELARKAVVGLIKFYAEVLKKLVSVVLFAFPKLAKKFNALIDKAVDLAVKAVNKLADVLKKAVCALLDILGATLDAVLAAYQQVFNMVMSAIELIAVGLLRIMEGIANLVSSARLSPGHFFGQMSEELLGQDVTQPLPNEYKPVTEDTSEAVTSASAPDMEQRDAETLDKQTSYHPDQVEADQVVTDAKLDPVLMSKLAGMEDGATVEFGATDDKEHSMEAVKRDAVEAERDLAAQGPEEKAPEPAAATTATGKTEAQPTGQAMVGPFNSPMERAGYVIGTMKDAVVKWFSENKVAIIAGIIAGIGGVILANILTGGAIMAALPLLMQIIGAYFAAEGIYQAAKHFGGYLGAAWPGNLVEGATKLARGLAVITIELIFALLFGGKAALKGAKTAVKTVAKQGVKGAVKTGAKAAKTAVKKSVKETAKAATDLAKVGKKGAKALVRNGKVAMKGVRKGFAKGAKTFDDLGQRLSKKLRFKKFRMRIEKRRFKLEGEVNPWVILATGDVVWDKQKGVKSGDKVKVVHKGNSVDGIVLGGKTKSVKPVKETLTNNQKTSQELFKALSKRDTNSKQLIESLQELPRNKAGNIRADKIDEALELLESSKALRTKHSEDLIALEHMMKRLRKQRDIRKYSPKDGTGLTPGAHPHVDKSPFEVTGGTVGAGKTSVDDEILTGSSTYAQVSKGSKGSAVHHDRYSYPGTHGAAKNHAEQTILGKAADKFERKFKIPKDQRRNVNIPKKSVEGTLNMHIDQAVCAACRQGFKGSKNSAAGIIKQFSQEFPNVQIVATAANTGEIIIIKNGILLIQ